MIAIREHESDTEDEVYPAKSRRQCFFRPGRSADRLPMFPAGISVASPEQVNSP
jgi:hypothetical protein